MAKRQAVVEEIEEVEGPEESSGGAGIEMGIIIATFLALCCGLFLGFKELGAHYGVGPLAG